MKYPRPAVWYLCLKIRRQYSRERSVIFAESDMLLLSIAQANWIVWKLLPNRQNMSYDLIRFSPKPEFLRMPACDEVLLLKQK